jgi:hypothetical protein
MIIRNLANKVSFPSTPLGVTCQAERGPALSEVEVSRPFSLQNGPFKLNKPLLARKRIFS